MIFVDTVNVLAVTTLAEILKEFDTKKDVTLVLL